VSEVAADAAYVRSLERGLAVLRALDAPPPGRTIADVSRATDLPRAAVRRALLTLQQLGYVRADNAHYRLTPRVLELGYAYLSSLEIGDLAQPHIEALSDELGEASALTVLDGAETVCVASAKPKRILTTSARVGTRFPAAATASGRVLLAALSPLDLDAVLGTGPLPRYTRRTITSQERLRAEIVRVRRQGYSLVDEELEDGLRATAAPIHDAAGTVIAAANVAANASRTTLDAVRNKILPQLLLTARRIEDDLRRSRPDA